LQGKYYKPQTEQTKSKVMDTGTNMTSSTDNSATKKRLIAGGAGVAAGAAYLILNNGTTLIDDKGKKGNHPIDDIITNTASKVADTVDRMRNSIEDAATDLGNAIGNAVKTVNKSLVDVVKSMQDTGSSIGNSIRNISGFVSDNLWYIAFLVIGFIGLKLWHWTRSRVWKIQMVKR
jgi:hypothetical protein